MLALYQFEQAWVIDKLQLSSLAEEVTKLKAENAEYQKKCAEFPVLENQLNSATEEAPGLKGQLSKTRNDMIVLVSLYKATKVDLLEAKQTHVDMKGRLEGQIRAARGELASLQGKVENLENQLVCMNAKYNATEAKLSQQRMRACSG